MEEQFIGRPVPRKEAREKVTGQSRYVDDLRFPGTWFGATVRSECARGRIRGVKFGEGIPWKELTIVTARALPDKYLLEEARRAVHIECEPLAPVFTIEDSLRGAEVIWGKDNVFKSFQVEKGNVDRVWSQADFIVEGEYRTGAQEQLYIETNGVIAVANPDDGVTVWGSMQCPYYVHKALMVLFALPANKVRVVQAETGGGFGGKEEYPSMIAGHAALLAWKSGKPVKIVYDRAEDMAATTKRHPSRT